MITLPRLALLLAAAASLASASVVTSNSGGNFELLILHNNDMHARFEQTSQLSGACTTADREAGKCYGGFPRVAYVVKEARRAAASGEGPPVLYLNAGDTYTGTAWFTIYKWKVAAEFLNALKPDAVSLGSNEFAQSSAKLSPLVNNIESSILATNIILNSEEKYKLKKSLIFDVEGVKVGVIGYLTLETNVIDFTSSVEYIDEVLALSEEVKNLKEKNIDMIIALGHANVDKVIEIATEVDGIDLVINGYKNVYLWNGTTIEDSGIGNENHLIVKQASGKTVQIVQSHSYNNYLGKIIVKFNDGYKITEFQIGQVSLDLSIPQDSEALQVIKTYSEDIERIRQEVIGSTAVVLDGDSCKWDECNLGNLITDSIMYYYAVRFQGERWTDAPVAIIQSSAITASIAPEKRPADVTMGNLLSALQRESNLVTVTMNGTVLTQVLEHSVANYRRTNPSGQFLQYSGIRVTYDLAKESGSRLVDAVVRCWSCSVPEFYSIDDWREYTLIMPLSLANGEQGFSMLVGLPRRNLAYDEVSCAQAYIAQRSPVYPEVSGRIILLNVDSVPDSAASLNSLFALVFGILSFMIGHNLIYTM